MQQRAFPVMVSYESSPLKILRFTTLLLGLAPSSHLLQGVIDTHLVAWANEYPDEVELSRRTLYVDDLLSGGFTIEQAETVKNGLEQSWKILQLYKWCSNVPALEAEKSQQLSKQLVEKSDAKTQLQVQSRKSKVLGLKLDKENDHNSKYMFVSVSSY